jgi:Flp pilus assembly protein TadB
MKVNIGAFDGWVRTLLFLVSVCYAILAGGYAWLWVIPTAILFATVVLMWCPLYEVLGINTNTDKEIHL